MQLREHPGMNKEKPSARDIMRTGIISVAPELSIDDLDSLLTSEDVSGAPVISRNGELVGMVSKTDVVRALSEELPQRVREELLPSITVSEIMTPDVVILPPDAPVERIAAAMIDGGLHRVLIADGEEVLGIVTTLDLVRLLV